jgi:hypothetical protein
MVSEKKFPDFFMKDEMSPFMYLDIADIRVSVYHLQLPKEFSSLSCFSSYKLRDYQFVETKQLLKNDLTGLPLRSGVIEAVKGYQKHMNLIRRNLSVNPLQEKSILNKELATVTIDIEA